MPRCINVIGFSCHVIRTSGYFRFALTGKLTLFLTVSEVAEPHANPVARVIVFIPKYNQIEIQFLVILSQASADRYSWQADWHR